MTNEQVNTQNSAPRPVPDEVPDATWSPLRFPAWKEPGPDASSLPQQPRRSKGPQEFLIELPVEDGSIVGAWTLWTRLGDLLFRRHPLRRGPGPQISLEFRWSGTRQTMVLWVPRGVTVQAMLEILANAWPAAAISIRPGTAPLPIPAHDRQQHDSLLPADPAQADRDRRVTMDLGVALQPPARWSYPLPGFEVAHPSLSQRISWAGRFLAQEANHWACVQMIARPLSRWTEVHGPVVLDEIAVHPPGQIRGHQWEVAVRLAVARSFHHQPQDLDLRPTPLGLLRAQQDTQPAYDQMHEQIDRAVIELGRGTSSQSYEPPIMTRLERPSVLLAERRMLHGFRATTFELAQMAGLAAASAGGQP